MIYGRDPGEAGKLQNIQNFQQQKYDYGNIFNRAIKFKKNKKQSQGQISTEYLNY